MSGRCCPGAFTHSQGVPVGYTSLSVANLMHVSAAESGGPLILN